MRYRAYKVLGSRVGMRCNRAKALGNYVKVKSSCVSIQCSRVKLPGNRVNI